MQTRKQLLLCAAAVALCALCAATEIRANPSGVPVTEPGPTSCTTLNGTGNFTITAELGPNGEFPQVVACSNPVNAGKQCALYAYDISSPSKNVDHTVFAVSADQNLDSTNPISPPTGVNPPGVGDNATGFLVFADHEYTVAFNAAGSKRTHVEMVIVGPSAARITTMLVRSGTKITEHCLIAGPGVASFTQPITPLACVKLDQNTSMRITRGANYCATGPVQFFTHSTDCTGTPIQVTGVQIPGLVYSGDPGGNVRCGEILRQTRHSPTRFTYESGGYVYEFCYDNETGDVLDCSSF